MFEFGQQNLGSTIWAAKFEQENWVEKIRGKNGNANVTFFDIKLYWLRGAWGWTVIICHGEGKTCNNITFESNDPVLASAMKKSLSHSLKMTKQHFCLAWNRSDNQ